MNALQLLIVLSPLVFPVLLVAAMFVSRWLRERIRPDGDDRIVPTDPADLAVLRDGRQGLFEATMARLTHQHIVDLEIVSFHQGKLELIDLEPVGLCPGDEVIVSAAQQGLWAKRAFREFRREAARRAAALVDAGALMGTLEFLVHRLLTILPVVVVWAAAAGFFAFDKSPSFAKFPLPFELFLAVFAIEWFWRTASRTTRAGARALEVATSSNVGLREAMGTAALEAWSPRQVALAVALFGLAPLEQSSLGHLEQILHPYRLIPSVNDGAAVSCDTPV